jgi:hypothetical protein
MYRVGIFALECLFSGIFLWLGLYLVTHDPRNREEQAPWWQRPALSSGASLLCVAWYLLGVANQIIAEDSATLGRWMRLTYWAVPLACALILAGILAVTTPEHYSQHARRIRNRISAVVLLCALGLALGGTFTDWFYDFGAVRRVERPPYYLEIPPRYPNYGVMVVFIIGTLLAMAFVPLWRYFSMSHLARQQFRWIAVAGILETLGATVGILGITMPDLSLAPEIGDAMLVTGIIFLGYGVAQHNAILRNRDITRDFYRSLVGAATISGIFVLFFIGGNVVFDSTLSLPGFPLLAWLAILTIMLRPWVGEQLDRLFLSASSVAIRQTLQLASMQIITATNEREELREIEEELPRAITQTVENLRAEELRERIARHVNSIFRGTNYARRGGTPYVALESDLLTLAVVEDSTTALMRQDGVMPQLDRQPYQLKAFEQIIETLVSTMEAEAVAIRATNGGADSQRYQRMGAQAMILRQQFLGGIPRVQVQRHVESKYNIGYGGGYGRLLNDAKEDLATRLYRAELRARSARSEISEKHQPVLRS